MNDLWLKKSDQAANTYMDEVSRANQFTSYHNGYTVHRLECVREADSDGLNRLYER